MKAPPVRRVRLALLLLTPLAAACFNYSPAAANMEGTVTVYGGKTTWSKYINIQRKPIFGAQVAMLSRGRAGVEANIGFVSSHSIAGSNPWLTTLNVGGEEEMKSLQYGADVIYYFLPNSFTPYLTGGWRHVRFKSGDVDHGTAQKTNRNGFDAALGARFNFVPSLGVRAEVRDVMFRFKSPPTPEPPSEKLLHSVFYTVGLQLTVGHKGPAPPPPPPAPVTIVVQAEPPPPPPPAPPQDTDGDGVIDSLDQCPDTPRGATVDARGCPMDTDGDGVFDGLDKCPDTPQGVRVDKDGCPIVINEKETELLDTGKITTRDIHFRTAKWDILPESYATLDQIGDVLVNWPQLKIEIGGHCDARGSDAYNMDLSQKRSESVLGYLLSHYPKISREQYTAVGYGERQPVADNKTVEGMAANRRVEFKVLNTEELKKERERRHMVPKSGGN